MQIGSSAMCAVWPVVVQGRRRRRCRQGTIRSLLKASACSAVLSARRDQRLPVVCWSMSGCEVRMSDLSVGHAARLRSQHALRDERSSGVMSHLKSPRLGDQYWRPLPTVSARFVSAWILRSAGSSPAAVICLREGLHCCWIRGARTRHPGQIYPRRNGCRDVYR